MVRRWWGDGKGLVRRRNGGEEDNDAAFGGATRHATSLQRPWGLHLRSVRYAHGEAVGGGIFALRRPRPYSRV